MKKLKVGIIGATGYAGAELVRLLLLHPKVEISAISSASFEGKTLFDVYPSFSGRIPLTLVNAEQVIENSDVVFAALPHGLSEELAAKCDNSGVVFIDLGADFRLKDEKQYIEWYQNTYKHKEIHKKATYCLPEYNREKIKSCDTIANPGCYPTSIALALIPAIKNKLIDEDMIIIDSKSGVTGAGRMPTQMTHYPDVNEAFCAYKAGAHRHTPEIEQTLSEISQKQIKITFVPHLLPVNRGILSTIYCRKTTDFNEIYKCYKEYYKDEYFVRIMPNGEYANIKNVRLSNYCDISIHEDKNNGMLIITSAIDNMIKGASGQAIQNMNIRFGFPETDGISMLPNAF